jgi:parallel beta-helix repeat protein
MLSSLAGLPASAATYYTATDGNDGNPGSSGQPFRTMLKGVTSLRPGDTLLVQPGVYEETLNYRIPSGSSWSQAVVVRAANPQARPVLRTPAGQSWGLLFQDQQFVILDGFVIDAVNVQYDALKITQPSTHDIRVMNSEIKNARAQGILTTDGAYQIELLNLDVHSNGTTDFDHGIYLSTGSAVISGCRIYRNAGWGISAYKESGGGVSNNTIRNNFIFQNAALGKRGDGILVSGGSGNAVYNNVVWANEVGIWVDYGASATTVYHNTVVNNRGEFGIYIGPGATGTFVRNNISRGNTRDIENRGESTTISNNLAGVNPLFVNESAADFRLQVGSPAIDAAFATGVVTTDVRGQTRSQGAAPDIGAYELDRPPTPPGNVRVIQGP